MKSIAPVAVVLALTLAATTAMADKDDDANAGAKAVAVQTAPTCTFFLGRTALNDIHNLVGGEIPMRGAPTLTHVNARGVFACYAGVVAAGQVRAIRVEANGLGLVMTGPANATIPAVGDVVEVPANDKLKRVVIERREFRQDGDVLVVSLFGPLSERKP